MFAILVYMDSDVSALAKHFKKVIPQTADEVLGRRKNRTQPRVSDEVHDPYNSRKDKKLRNLSSLVATVQHGEHGSTEKTKEATQEKRNEDMCKGIEQTLTAGRSTKDTQCSNQNPKTNSPYGIRWAEYCNDRYNYIQPGTSIKASTGIENL